MQKTSEIADYLKRKKDFYANEVALGQKNAQNERVHNSLIISENLFKNNWFAIEAQLEYN